MDPDMRLGIQMTHSDECYRWHHECAVVKVDSLRARIEVLEKALRVIATGNMPCGSDAEVARAALKEG